MSGPKVTVYYLTEEQRAAIRAERLRQQREREKRNKLLIGADEYNTQLKSMLQSIEQFAPVLDAVRQWMPYSPLPAAVQSFSVSVSKAQIAVKAATREHDLAVLERKLKAISGEIFGLKSAFSDLTKQEQTAKENLQSSGRECFRLVPTRNVGAGGSDESTGGSSRQERRSASKNRLNP